MAEQAQRAQPKFRRVVTGHDENAKPIIWIDGEATNHKFPDDVVNDTISPQASRRQLRGLPPRSARGRLRNRSLLRFAPHRP